MAGFVELPIPANVENRDEESLRRHFQDQMTDIRCGFSAALDLACDQKCTHAILENVTITHVSVVSDSIEIDYCVELSEFEACKDLISNYSFQRTVAGKKFGNVWRFEKHIPAPERSTCDEL